MNMTKVNLVLTEYDNAQDVENGEDDTEMMIQFRQLYTSTYLIVKIYQISSPEI